MKFPKILYTLLGITTVNKTLLNELYAFTVKIVFILMLSSVMVALLFYPVLKNEILYWLVSFWIVAFLRLFSAYLYKHKVKYFTLKQWYILYVFFAFLVAIIYASLSILFISELSVVYQLLLAIILVGLSSGAITAFPSNYRLGILYLLTVMLPLIVSLGLTGNYTYILVIMLLYVLGTIGMIFRNYKHELAFESLETEHKQLNNLLKEAPVGIFIYDTDMIVQECNAQFLTMFDNDRNVMIGLDLKTLPDTRATNALLTALKNQVQFYKGSYYSTKGKVFWIEAKIFPYKNKHDEIIGSIVLIEDKSKEKSFQDELTYLAEHDVLTGLKNRRGMHHYMEHLIQDSKHKDYYSLLFYLDLNQFKGINDSLGHSTGDKVLVNVSKRLQYILGDDYHISRLGGDEFIVIVDYVATGKDEAKKEATQYLHMLQNVFTDPFVMDDLHLHIQASIGVVKIEPKYENIEEIIRHADIAMYQAKRSYGSIAYYNETLDARQKDFFTLQHDLAYAVEKAELLMHFQPIVTIDNETVYAAEALMRWHHPVRGMLSPDTFIDLSIKAGLLSNMTWWVVDEVCSHVQKWKEEGVWNLEYVSINVNAQQLIENNFATEFLGKLKRYGLDTTDILIEITERSLIDNFDATQTVISTLRQHGVHCAIDDFGVGYSSLSYLKKLSFHTLKIDKEFIKDIESNPKELLLVSTILDIGRQFNYHIVIEGIEDKKQKDLLLGLDEGLRYQGYFFSKPLPAEVFREKMLG